MLSRTHVSTGCLSEYEAFAALIEGLNDKQWNADTRCAGWQARDVAGHVIGLAVRHESPAGAAARLRAATATLRALVDAIDDDVWNGPSGVPDLTLGEGVLTLWYDTYVHADDIRAAIGRTSERGPGLDATIAYLAGQLTAKHWGPATLALDEVSRHDVSGGGPEITGDALQFALVATGRADASTIGLDGDVSIY